MRRGRITNVWGRVRQNLTERHISSSRWLVVAAILPYFFWVILLGARSVGLEYDEALLQHGAVHMLNSSGEPTFAHDWGSWLRFGGRFWQLTLLPYAGAVKSYLVLVPFALFGPDLLVIRAISAVMAAFGIFGIARLLQSQLGSGVAVAVALTLSIHPAFILHTFYDNSYFGLWIASTGLVCLTLRWYLARPSLLPAIFFGFALGIGVWGRVNFLWFLAAALVGAAIGFGRRLVVPRRHLLTIGIGGIIGCLPMMLYQYRSRLGIIRFMTSPHTQHNLLSLIPSRLRTLVETLVVNDENRAIWGGVTIPYAAGYTLALIILLALLYCILVRDLADHVLTAWKRASAITFVLFTVLMCTSSLPVRGHHLVALVPIGALAVVLSLKSIASRWRLGRPLGAAVALVYLGLALSWDVTAVRGVRSTGGVGPWSDAIVSVSQHLQSHYDGREIKILDWGLQNNLYVLSNAKIRSRELFWVATTDKTGHDRTWDEEIADGGVFLIRSEGNRSFPDATRGMLTALAASNRNSRRLTFYQRNGKPYAEIIDVGE